MSNKKKAEKEKKENVNRAEREKLLIAQDNQIKPRSEGGEKEFNPITDSSPFSSFLSIHEYRRKGFFQHSYE